MAQEADPAAVHGVQEAVEHYSQKSESELYGDLKRMTSAQMQSGELTPEGMDAVAARLAPMLTPEQRQRMQALLSQLKQ